jgi:acetylornithine deacetylase/succinyl-diaminopimelate desuccinylase-like protein
LTYGRAGQRVKSSTARVSSADGRGRRNLVAARRRLTFACRMLPGEALDQAKVEIWQVIERGER